MNRLRTVLARLILVGFAVFGMFFLVGGLVLALALSGLGGIGDLLAEMLVWTSAAAALAALVPGVVLVVSLRRPHAGAVLATLYGALVAAVCAGLAREDEAFVLPLVAGLLLVVCAFPLRDAVDSAA